MARARYILTVAICLMAISQLFMGISHPFYPSSISVASFTSRSFQDPQRRPVVIVVPCAGVDAERQTLSLQPIFNRVESNGALCIHVSRMDGVDKQRTYAMGRGPGHPSCSNRPLSNRGTRTRFFGLLYLTLCDTLDGQTVEYRYTIDHVSQRIPLGAFSQSCQMCRVVQGTLFCMCKADAGTTKVTRLQNAFSCVGSIQNVDGALTCHIWNPPIPDGSYQDGCQGCRLDGTTLWCQCENGSGQYNATALPEAMLCNDVWLDHGRLACNGYERSTITKGKPLGAFAKSCTSCAGGSQLADPNRAMSPDPNHAMSPDVYVTLTCKCAGRGGHHVSSLVGAINCIQIDNVNGALTCTQTLSHWRDPPIFQRDQTLLWECYMHVRHARQEVATCADFGYMSMAQCQDRCAMYEGCTEAAYDPHLSGCGKTGYCHISTSQASDLEEWTSTGESCKKPILALFSPDPPSTDLFLMDPLLPVEQ